MEEMRFEYKKLYGFPSRDNRFINAVPFTAMGCYHVR